MIGFPLLLIPLAIYNIFVFLMPGVVLTAPATTITLPSGAGWVLTFGDAIAVVGLFLLFIEVVKASRPGARSLMDHLLSLVAFGVAAAEFAWLPQFATSAFFLLTAMILVEFLAGAAFSLRRGRGGGSRGMPPAVPPAIAEPVAPASPVVPAQVAETHPDAGAKPPQAAS
jgi:cbb3-type cytochrome oxidase subunit 3